LLLFSEFKSPVPSLMKKEPSQSIFGSISGGSGSGSHASSQDLLRQQQEEIEAEAAAAKKRQQQALQRKKQKLREQQRPVFAKPASQIEIQIMEYEERRKERAKVRECDGFCFFCVEM